MTGRAVHTTHCIFCRAKLLRYPSAKFKKGQRCLLTQPSICMQCGWWSVFRVHQGEHPATPELECYAGAIGCLKELDLTDISAPLHEIRAYLVAKGDRITRVHPRLFEQVVCSVFRDLGWRARATAYSGDDGVDVILQGRSKGTIGVQVKRYRRARRIEAEQIRSLTGALMLGGHTKGIFVTTSSFRRGATKTAAKATAIGYPIRLMDADRFLRALGIAQLKSFRHDRERIVAHLLSKGAHLGSGPMKVYQPGEDLYKRVPVISIWTRQDYIDLYGNA
jgi:restriction system protein